MLIKPYKDDDTEKEFDRRVMRLVWFSIACLVAGIVISHYWH